MVSKTRHQAQPLPQCTDDGPLGLVGTEQLIALRQALAQLTDEIRSLRQDLRASMQLKGKAKPFYTVREAADLLGRTPYTIRRWIRDGKLEATKPNGGGARDQYLIEVGELRELLLSGGTQERTLVNRGASGYLRSSSGGKGAGSGAASPGSGDPYNGQ